ncbi:MAG: NAD(P)H-dependent oxidoreductase [Klebsiella variicola]|nr:NAD(P)H-dependent oxidoreductase [Klebsiella variicola]
MANVLVLKSSINGETSLTNQLINEFLAARRAKKWFDLVARARETFRYTDSWPQGLVEGVRAVVVSSRGGIHQGETTDAITPYLRAVLGLMGIHEVEFIYAEGLDNRPHGRDAGIASARAQIAQLAVPA